ncbi:hypothetical protein ES677_00900 [Bizionia gelidisalsuginis]|uniref:Uncharacterized protein n=2 Tax=Bizionia TaxID=283785 RepID=A0A8H2QG09_9FLAO|nr:MULTISPECIES: hypothetical protein [Bizionia]TYB77352.1 hypothetical protein ES676_03410 [Bizionia saleffrena]TYC17965.1 hypothetical protein ES677_00900 [Bizionia gelidisalsuginis]
MIKYILNTKKAHYSSNLNGDNLRQKIEDIFGQNNLKFVGKFTSQNAFEAYDKWTYIKWYVPNFKRKTAYLNGEIITSEKGSLLQLNIKPNPVIAIFPILTVLIGIITLIVAASNNKTLIFGLLIIVVAILFHLFGMFLRSRLQNNFKNHLDLQKV